MLALQTSTKELEEKITRADAQHREEAGRLGGDVAQVDRVSLRGINSHMMRVVGGIQSVDKSR